MKNHRSAFLRLASAAIACSGVLFILYPSIRPFSDETSLSGAAAFASAEWIVSHMMAIAAFILLCIGLLGFYIMIQHTNLGKLALNSLILTLVGTGLTLPFYGVEVFGLYVLGREAISQQSLDFMELAETLRFGPGFYLILAGLLIIAVGMVVTAMVIWKSGIVSKWSGFLLAFGFLMYLPQYMAPQTIRIAHGAVITIGCLWIAAGIWRESEKAIRSLPNDRTRPSL